MRLPPWLAVVLALIAACGGDGGRDGGTPAVLTGAGATFPFPLYSRWIAEYQARTGVRINYQSIGSGGGVRQLSAGTVDFGATDVPMTPRERAALGGRRVLHVPMVLGAVAVTYNLPTVPRPLRLSGEVMADLFLGRIARWNDPRLAALNPGVALPAADVLIVHRADGSGSTYILTDYLSAVSAEWAAGPSRGKDVRWPVGAGAKGADGVAGLVKATPGAVGYVEAGYARQHGLPAAELRNRDGAFVAPSAESISAAALGIPAASVGTEQPSLVNAPGAASYPMASFTWLLLDPARARRGATRALVDFVRWALHDGTPVAVALGYAPVPAAVAARVDATLAALRASTAPGSAARGALPREGGA